MPWDSLVNWLVKRRVTRLLCDSLIRSRARRHLVALETQPAAQRQAQVLLGLVHRARNTRFGRDHDFGRVRTAADFQRLVPLQTANQLWRSYWQPALPNLAGVTWPGPVAVLAAHNLGVQAPPTYLPVTSAGLAAHQSAAWIALGHLTAVRPEARLLNGQIVLLAKTAESVPLARRGRRQGMAVSCIPGLCRPFLTLPVPNAGSEWLAQTFAETRAKPVTCIAGRTDDLLRFFDLLRKETGSTRVTEVWPELVAVIHARGTFPGDRGLLAHAVGDPGVTMLETWTRPEGTLGIEDPRHGLMRLLTHHGAYFEFVPLDQLQTPSPMRLGVGDIEIDVPYALAVTSPAGYWATLIDTPVRFVKREPLLFEIVDSCKIQERPKAATVPYRHELPKAGPAFPSTKSPGIGAPLAVRSPA